MSARGIFAAIVTPVDDQGVISLERYCRHARWLLRQGCHGIGLFGTTGETQAFTVAERQAALEGAIAAGLPPEKMILGVGCCARNDSLALARHALDHGVTRLLALPPFFYKNNPDEGLFRAFAEIVEGVGDPRMALYLYHFPQVSGVPVTKPVIEKLLDRYPEAVRGLKDSSGDWDHTRDLIKSFPGFAVFSGADTHLLSNLEAGGAGTISAAANLNCAASRRVFDAFEKGDRAAAEEGMTLVAAVRKILQNYPLIPAIKYVIAQGNHDPFWARVRPPMVELDDATGRRLLEELEAAGYAYDPNLYTVAGA